MKVVLSDVETGALAQTEAEMKAAGAKVLAVPTDVSSASDLEALAGKTIDAFGAVHILCNNAGVPPVVGPSWELTEADWQWVLGVNLWGVIHGIRAFVPIMLKQGSEGHIVNTASIAGLLSAPWAATYDVAKHGVVTLSESLHRELALTGSKVKVSVLCPAWVKTQLMDGDRNRPSALRGESAPESASSAGVHDGAGIPPVRGHGHRASRDRRDGPGRHPGGKVLHPAAPPMEGTGPGPNGGHPGRTQPRR